MKLYRTCAAALIFLLLLGADIHAASGKERPKDSSASTGGEAKATPDIDPKVQSVLRKMGEHLPSRKRFRSDGMLEFLWTDRNGELFAKAGSSVQMRVERPNKFAWVGEWVVEILGEVGDDGTVRQRMAFAIFSDGKECYRQLGNKYAVAETPDDLHSVADMIAGEDKGAHGVLAALVSDDPAKILLEDVGEAKYLGRENINGVECHHMKLVQADGDWQWELWIGLGDRPLLRRWLVRKEQKRLKVEEIYRFTEWDTSPRFMPEDFQFTPPPDAVKVDSPDELQP